MAVARRRQRACRARRVGRAAANSIDLTDALDILPDLEPPPEPTEPAVVLETQGEIALIRGGFGAEINLKQGSLIRFMESDAVGVMLFWKESVGAVQIEYGKVSVGEGMKAFGQFKLTEASPAFGGRMISSEGSPMDERPAPPVPPTSKTTFADFAGFMDRSSNYRPLFTGVQSVDFSVPVGRGQTMLFQGTDKAKDKRYLWADLMESRALRKDADSAGPDMCVCACSSLEEAKEMRTELEARGCYDRCVLVVPQSSGPGAAMVAMNGALAFAEQMAEQGGEATVIMELEPLHRVWNIVAKKAGEERRERGILVDPKDDAWVEFEGTVLQESIAERRKVWFALISRAANMKESSAGGSVSILGWLWEKEGGDAFRRQQAYEKKLETIMAIPRIDDATRERLISKVEKEAAEEGVVLPERGGEKLSEPDEELPGVPNWEIEELKSITDGHILLRTPSCAEKEEDSWAWNLDPYISLPRLGTDAMHPALITVGAHKLRLKMLQGRDRATMLHDTLGAPQTLDEERLELRFAELLLEQRSGKTLSVDEEVARLMVVMNENCKELREEGGCTTETLDRLASKLLESDAGKKVSAEISKDGKVTAEARKLLMEEMDLWYKA